MSNLKKFASFSWLLLTIIICFNIYSSSDIGKEFFETINMFLLMLGGYGVIITIINHSETLIENSEELKRRNKIDKIENTFNLLKAWDDEHLFQARKLTREIKDQINDISNNDLVKKINNDEDLRQSVILVFNYIENVRFSIKNKRIDNEQFKSSLGDALKDIIKRFEPYAKNLSKETYEDMQECSDLLSK